MHGIIIGQLLRFARNCDNRGSFVIRAKNMYGALREQHFDKELTKTYYVRFLNERKDFVIKYNIKNVDEFVKLCCEE